jgi:predicted O-methyltransferase YrrM
MSSAAEDGRLLTALAAAKPGGAILELGTGLGTASLLAGMNAAVTLVTVELSQPDHQAGVDELFGRLGALPGWHSFRMDHGSGVMVCTSSG